MNLDEIGGIARLINHYASMSVVENNRLEADPTEYFAQKIRFAGFEVPEGFHVHCVAQDGDAPNEDPETETVDRTVFTLNSRNELSRADFPAAGKIGELVKVGSHGNCNGCKGVCIVKTSVEFA